MPINATDYGAVGDGITDNTIALQNALNATYSAKTSLYIPSGNYLISGSLSMPFSSGSVYNQGNYVYGDGMLNTIITLNAANIIGFEFVQPINYKFMLGSLFQDLSIHGGGFSNTTGISAQAVYQFDIDRVEISGCTYGITFINTSSTGDGDACNHVILNNSLIQNNAYWGIYLSLVSGNNETSFLSINDTTIQNCGTAAGAIGGGMYWRGQMLEFNNSAFVTNQNRGLYVEGGSGLGSNIQAHNLCLENNTGMGFQCYGLVNAEFHNIQLYNNDTFKASYGMYFNASSYYIANIKVHSAKVRATAGNSPYTAFMATGANIGAGTLILDSKQIRWDNFGYAGQTQYSGFTAI